MPKLKRKAVEADPKTRVAPMYARGFSLRDICAELRLGKKTVVACLHDAGVRLRTAAEAQRIGCGGLRVLTEEKVVDIRARRARTSESWAKLGRRHGASEDATRLAGLGITWKHVPMPEGLLERAAKAA